MLEESKQETEKEESKQERETDTKKEKTVGINKQIKKEKSRKVKRKKDLFEDINPVPTFDVTKSIGYKEMK